MSGGAEPGSRSPSRPVQPLVCARSVLVLLAPCKCLQKTLHSQDSPPEACGSFISPRGDHKGSKRNARGVADTLMWLLS